MGQAVRDLADELQVSSLYDWPCVGAQRVHALYRWSWVPNGAGEPVCAVGLGWHWGTLLDGRTTGNDGTRPYVAVTAQPRQLEAVTRAVGGLVPAGRQAAHRLCGYPSWFWLPPRPRLVLSSARRRGRRYSRRGGAGLWCWTTPSPSR